MVPRSQHQNRPRLTFVLGALVVLTCLRVWTGPQPILPRAEAQIPDSAAQRKQILDEVRRTNDLLVQVKDLLEKGTLNVRVQGADNP